MRKKTENMFTVNFVSVKEVDTKLIGTNTEEMVSVAKITGYDGAEYSIPVICSYPNKGINKSGAKIGFVKTTLDGTSEPVYGVKCTPEHFMKENMAEILLTKVFTIYYLYEGFDSIAAEAHARARVATEAALSIGKVNRVNGFNSIRDELRIGKLAKGNFAEAKKLEKETKKIEKEDKNKPDLAQVIQDTVAQVTDNMNNATTTAVVTQ